MGYWPGKDGSKLNASVGKDSPGNARRAGTASAVRWSNFSVGWDLTRLPEGRDANVRAGRVGGRD